MARSRFLRHAPCSSCGSSDAAGLYDDGSIYCHKCGARSGDSLGEVPDTPHKRSPKLNLITDLTFEPLHKRRLTEESCRKWGYGKATFHGQTVQVASYYRDLQPVAQKIRFANKDFRFLGDPSEAGLYGQHLWRDGGKHLIITEGELDAISVSQVQAHKWPVVSIPNGANGAKKALASQLEWLEKFENIVLMFDNDEPGQAAARECVDLFSPGKVKIASLPLKDASDMLQAGRGEEIIKAFWDARVLRPDGIVAGTEMWDRLAALPDEDHLPYPFPEMNPLLLGGRRGEITTICAGSGVGKSEFAAQIAFDWMMNRNETVGYVALEETVEHTALRFMGLHVGKRLTLDRESVESAELKSAYAAAVANGRLFLYDHFGSTDSDNLFSKLRFLVKGCGCTTVVLDHISIVVSGIEDGDERRIIDNLMTKLASLVQELNCRLILISHLRKADKTPHEEGGRVTLDHLRGSASIKQLSFDIVALERDQQDEQTKLYTHIRVLKCRRTGRTGSAGWVKWDDESGRLLPSPAPDTFDASTDEKETDF